MRSILFLGFLAFTQIAVDARAGTATFAMEGSSLRFLDSYSNAEVYGAIGYQPWGGNPSLFLRSNFILEHVTNSPWWVIYALSNSGANFSPGQMGAIRSINYSQGSLLLDGSIGSVETGLLLIQDGNYYALAPGIVTNQTSWTNSSRNGLLASDFVAISPSTPTGFDLNFQPDFSRHGSSIGFGLFSHMDSGMTNSTSYVWYGVDNWRVNIVFVPEPSSCLLGVIGFGLLRQFFRQRRKAAF